MSKPIRLENVSKTFGQTVALNNVSLQIHEGEMVGLIGASGSGKSTMLRTISGLIPSDKKDSRIQVGENIIQKNGVLHKNIRKFRGEIGFVFQKFNLVDRLKVITNVIVGGLTRIPLYRSVFHIFTKNELLEALDALERVGLENKAFEKAKSLSGGQQQRVAIARTLMQRSQIILADEPIASLDPESSRRVMKLLSRINKEDGVTILVSLHQVEYALKYCSRIIAIKEGQVVYDGNNQGITEDLLHDVYGSRFFETGLDDYHDLERFQHSEKKAEAVI
jgi:phosphonate transport system ATP-binding protein